jgi:N-formylglutamate deformylase
MRLPLLISVPHAGWRVPAEAEPYCILNEKDLLEDGDGGASEIYALEKHSNAFLTTDIARAIVDLNRAEDDRRPDGVVKTHTCWNVPVYRPFPPDDVIETLLARYYRPYHQKLTELARSGVKLGVDCHTMAAEGPPVGPDPGVVRPRVCLSNADMSCPRDWLESLQMCFQSHFGADVRLNDPFRGGFITRSHAAEIPWVQVELSRGSFMTNDDKREKVLAALTDWCGRRV